MPQYKVQIPGQGVFTVNSPEELTDEQAYMAVMRDLAPKPEPAKPAEPTFGGQVKEFAKGVLPGAIGMGQTALTGISALLPEETEKSARQYIDRGAAALKAPFAAAPGYEETVGRKFGEAVGSIGPFLAMGPLGAAGRVGMTALAGGAGAGEARLGAEQEGATAEQRSTATALGVIPGLAEVFAPMRILGRLSAPIQAGITNRIQRALVAGGEEAAQEAASQIAQNLIAKGVYKPDKAIIDQVGESAAYGGATGALVQGILDMAIGRRAKGTQQQPPQGAQQAAAATAVAPAMEAAIPEPTLRGEEAPTTEPAETPEEIAAGPKTKAQAKRLAAEQAAFLKQYEEQAALREQQAAEYERIKAMTPEEYAAEQMQGRAPTKKNTYDQKAQAKLDAQAAELGYQTEPTYPGQAYAAKQLALAQDREPIVNPPVIASYLMQDPEQARELVKNLTPIPGLSKSQSDTVLGGLKLQLAALDKKAAKDQAAQVAAEEERVATARERAAGLFERKPEDLLGAARAQPGFGNTLEELRGIRRIGEGPDNLPAYRGEPKKISERLGSAQEQLSEEEAPLGEDELINKLVETFPKTTGTITPGDVYLGLGTHKQNVRDLQAQLAVARMTRNRDLQEDIKRQLDEARQRQIPTEGGLGTEGGKTAAEFISRSKAPEFREGEAEGDKFASEQRSTLLGLIRLLASTKVMLPARKEAAIREAKELYVAQHAAEIEARRKAFGLPPMADWEIAEARARALEGLNTLTNNWGQFVDPVRSVKALQNITREAVYQNLYRAVKRKETETKQTEAEKNPPRERGTRYTTVGGQEIFIPEEKGPKIGAPDELTLKGQPRRSEDTKQDAINMVTMALTRQNRVSPTEVKQAAKSVGSLNELAKLFRKAEVGGTTVEMEPATIGLLEQLRDALPTSTDPDFHQLAREQAQRIVEGNLPNPNAVRELGEMLTLQEQAKRSETRPGATTEELQRTSAQPQRDLFPEAVVQTQRATASNFQKMLDSKNIQGLRDAIAKQRADNIAALQAVGKALPTINNRLTKAKENYKRTQKRAEAAGTEASAYVNEYKTALKDAQDLVVALRDELLILENQLRDVELTKEALATEPTDMRFLINAPSMLALEKPLRKSVKMIETEITNAQNLIAAIEASYKAQQTLVVPAQRRAEKTAKELEEAQNELSAVQIEAAREAAKNKAAADRAADEAKYKAFEGTVADINQQARLAAAQQRGREGLGLPGVRFMRDTASIKEDVANLRRKLGSKRSELEKRESGKRKNNDTAELRAEIDSIESDLAALYEKTTTIKSEITTEAQEREERVKTDLREQRDRQEAAEERKRRKLPPEKLAPTDQAALQRDIRTARISQPRTRIRVVEPVQAITNKLLEKRADLAETQRRIDFLKANGKDKVGKRKTELFKSLEEKAALQRKQLDRLSSRQEKFAAVERDAEKKYTGQQERAELQRLEQEKERFARGVETTSPDLSEDQVSMLEKNDIQGALDSLASEQGTSKLNQVVAQRLAAMLDNTNVELKNNLVDEDGKPVLGMATSKTVTLDRKGGMSQEILLHEGTHAATERVIVQYEKDPSKLSEIQRVAMRELIALHKAIQSDPRITSVSAKGSLSEFVAEVFSNKNLQDQMRNKKWRLSDAWKGFKSIIMRMLGVKNPETMLGAALQSVDALMIPSSQRMGGVEKAVTRQLSQKDIAALHTGSNSMRQFAEAFGSTHIKQKDRTAEDANRIGLDYLNDMEDNPLDYVAEVAPNKLAYDTRMSDGEAYDPKNLAHFFEATPQTIMNYEARNNEALRNAEAEEISTNRIDSLRLMVDNLKANPEYTYVEQALVAKAAAKFAVLSGKDGRLKLAEIAPDNRHPVAVVGKEDAAYIIRELRAGKPLKQAFLDGMQANADDNAKKNERKNGWQKFEQSDEYQAGVALNAGAANTSWCTGASVGTASDQLSRGDFYIYYKDGKPEVAIRMDGANKIGEVRGNTVNQSLTPEQAAVAHKFLAATNFTGATRYLDELHRKEELAKAFRDGTLLPPSALYNTKAWMKEEDQSNGITKFSIGNNEVYNFLDFSNIEGEVDDYKPEPPKNYEKLVRAKLQDSVKAAFDNNEYPGVSLNVFQGGSPEFEFNGTYYTVNIAEAKGVSEVGIFSGNYDFSNLTALSSVTVYSNAKTETTFPKIKQVDSVWARTDSEKAALTFAPNAVVGTIYSVSATNVSRLTLNNVQTVGAFNIFSGASAEFKLPDAKYVPEIGYNRRSLTNDAVAAGIEGFDTILQERKLFDAFTRYNRNIAKPNDRPKMDFVEDITRSLITELTGSERRATSIMQETSEEFEVGAPEPVRWRVPAMPALRVPLAPRPGTAPYLRVVTDLANELGRAPTADEIEAKLQDDFYETQERMREERRVAQQARRTLYITPTQQTIIEGENEARDNRNEPLLETDEEKAAFLEDYYKDHPGTTEVRIDPYNAIRAATYAYFDGAETANKFAERGKRYNELFGISEAVNRAMDRESTIDAPKRVADKPPVTGYTEAPETPRYARPQAEGFEDALSVAQDIIAKPKTIRQQVEANLGLAFRTQALDRLAPVEKVANEMLDPLRGSQMMYYLRMADQKMSFVQQAVARGVPQLVDRTRADGRIERLIESVKGPNLATVVTTLKAAPGMNAEAANQLFTLYLAGKRGERVGYDKLNFSVPEAKIKEQLDKIEANEPLRKVFEKAREEYNAYNRELMKFMEQTGALTPEEAQRLAKTNDYIPYYREENGNAMLVIGGEGTFKVGNLTDQPQLRQLIGGNDKILDFLTSSVQNTSMLLDMGLRNQAAKNVMFELADLKLAQFLGGQPSGPDIVRFKDKGVEKYVRVNTDAVGIPSDLLVKGMEGIPVNNSALVRTMGGFSTLLRRSITISPLYSARQLFRDSVAAPLLSGANMVPVVDALKQLGKSDTREKLEARGIVGGQIFTGTNEDLTRILGELQAGKMGVSQFIARAEAIAMEADALTRRAQYDSYIAQGLSEMEATLMALESMNFNRKGLSPSARMASQLIPFFNAQIQSLDVLYRAMTGKMPLNDRLKIQEKLYTRGALLAGTAIAYALLMQDDDTYKNAQPDEKYGNFFVHVPGITEAIRVPVPFEIGYIFKAIPEAIVNIMANEKGGEEAYKAFKNIAIQTIPGGSSALMPAAIKPLLENLTGYSFFSGRQLESKAEQMQLAQYRYRDNTSELAKQAGALTGTSPLKIENLIRGYTGGMGVALAQALNFSMPTAGSPEQATKRLSDAAVIGPLFQPADAGGQVSAVYDRITEIVEVQKTYDKLLKEGRGAEARELLQDNLESMTKSAVAGNAQQQLGKITQAMNAIKASSMTPDQKREQLDKLQALRIQIANSVKGAL